MKNIEKDYQEENNVKDKYNFSGHKYGSTLTQEINLAKEEINGENNGKNKYK